MDHIEFSETFYNVSCNVLIYLTLILIAFFKGRLVNSDPNKRLFYRAKSMAGVSRGLDENACCIASNRRKEANERERERSWVICWQRTYIRLCVYLLSACMRVCMHMCVPVCVCVGGCGRTAAEIKRPKRKRERSDTCMRDREPSRHKHMGYFERLHYGPFVVSFVYSMCWRMRVRSGISGNRWISLCTLMVYATIVDFTRRTKRKFRFKFYSSSSNNARLIFWKILIVLKWKLFRDLKKLYGMFTQN